MKILFVASEMTPFVKTGGLADVAGSLPFALQKEGHQVSAVLPLYSQIGEKYRQKMKKVKAFYVDLDWRSQYAGIYLYQEDNLDIYFIDNEYYFHRHALYGMDDDGERFAFFNKAAAMMIKELEMDTDIVHANDWHTGLVPLFIKDFAKGDSYYRNIKTVFTIHNLKYQGIFPPDMLGLVGLSVDYFNEEALKFYDAVNFMKAGIVFCDALTTVSSSYAQEIKYEFYGENLQGVIRKHEYKLMGIINGIDYDLYNPETDKRIPYHYSIKNPENKVKNKQELQKKFGLPVLEDVPVISMVSRLVDMKGLDLVRYILDELLQDDIQVVILGTGEKEYEDMFRHFEWKYPDKLSAHIYFNEEEAHLVYAGSDMFLMPSMVEPCGISQLIALRYGTIPIAREVGGLKDTVIPYNEHVDEGTGFTFANYNAHELLYTMKRAIEVYSDQDQWEGLVKRAMMAKHDWEKSSKEYIGLYTTLLHQRW
ncbi:MAG: glycogen synthase GlgA [Bacillota bacterium]